MESIMHNGVTYFHDLGRLVAVEEDGFRREVKDMDSLDQTLVGWEFEEAQKETANT